MNKLLILFAVLMLPINATNVDYSLTDGMVCPKGSYYDLNNKCKWHDYSEEEDLDFPDHVLTGLIRFDCPYRTSKYPSEEFARFLLQVEREAGFPPQVRGLLAAFACKESGYYPRAAGDRKFSKSGKYPKARGMYQFWGYAKKSIKKLYKTDLDKIKVSWWERPKNLKDYRLDPVYSSIYAAYLIAKQVPKVKKSCKTKNIYRVWAIAEARIARGPGMRCRDTTSHFKLMKRWHKAARNYEYY